jgi:uncharacterized protein (TIGR02246 family)
MRVSIWAIGVRFREVSPRRHAERDQASGRRRAQMTDDERGIRRVVDSWMAATTSGDLATILRLMTDDVIFMVPGQEPFGKGAFAAASESMKDMQVDGFAEIVELKVLGDWAFIRTRIEVAVTPFDGNLIRRSGYALSLLRRGADGQWQLARDANLVMTEG